MISNKNITYNFFIQFNIENKEETEEEEGNDGEKSSGGSGDIEVQ